MKYVKYVFNPLAMLFALIFHFARLHIKTAFEGMGNWMAAKKRDERSGARQSVHTAKHTHTIETNVWLANSFLLWLKLISREFCELDDCAACARSSFARASMRLLHADSDQYLWYIPDYGFSFTSSSSSSILVFVAICSFFFKREL